jgi:hypothetical protein
MDDDYVDTLEWSFLTFNIKKSGVLDIFLSFIKKFEKIKPILCYL